MERAKELLRSARFQETPLSSPRAGGDAPRDQAISEALSLLEAASGSGNAEGAYLLAEMQDMGEAPAPTGGGTEGEREGGGWGEGRVYADAVSAGSRDAMFAMAVNLTAMSDWTSSSTGTPSCRGPCGAMHRHMRPAEAEDLLRRAASGSGGGLGLALLAMARPHYEDSGAGFIDGAQGDEGACQKAYEVLRPAADEAVKAIQVRPMWFLAVRGLGMWFLVGDNCGREAIVRHIQQMSCSLGAFPGMFSECFPRKKQPPVPRLAQLFLTRTEVATRGKHPRALKAEPSESRSLAVQQPKASRSASARLHLTSGWTSARGRQRRRCCGR